MSIELRPTRVPVRFSGPDAEKLLGDVLTAPIRAEPGPAQWFALLSPQGKIQAEGLIGWSEDAFWADVDGAVAADFFRRMRLYRLRAKVETEDLTETHSLGWSRATAEAGIVHEDGRLAGLGYRVIAPKVEASGWAAGNGWTAARVASGVAELGPDFAADTTYPHDIGMDLLGGVDFRKGCYVGQEVVSRMQHRGTARRRPVIVSGVAAHAGAALMAAGRDAGTLGEVVDGRAIAIARLDRLGDPIGATVEGRPVSLELPPWATYAFGESATAE